MNKTTEALKRVEVWVESLTGLHPDVRKDQGEILDAIREALAEQDAKQLFLDQVTFGTSVSVGGKRIDPADFYAEPVKQEPVAWVDLTDEEIEELIDMWWQDDLTCKYSGLVSAVIAAFKEKNK